MGENKLRIFDPYLEFIKIDISMIWAMEPNK